jgi:hypothetical protein
MMVSMSEVIINPYGLQDTRPWKCIWCAGRFEHNQSTHGEHFTVFAARFITQIIFTDHPHEEHR